MAGVTDTNELYLLLVEDNEDDAALMAAHLEGAGFAFRITRVDTVDGLLTSLQSCKYDLIVSDNNLPGFDAVWVLEQFKANCGDIPFIVVSGELSAAEAVALIKAGASDYVRKDNLMFLPPAIDRALRETAERRARQDVIQKLETAKAEAEAANKAKSTFLANMSHEIRTPLGAVLGFAELLQDPTINATDRAGYLQTILRNGKQLATLIDDILDLSKVEAGKLDIETVEVALPEFFAEVTGLFTKSAQSKGVQMRVESEGFIPRRIIADALRVRQIIINVLSNALKFTSAGGHVAVKFSYDKEAQGSFLNVEVSDSGIGIASEKHLKIFEQFTQADGSTTRKFGGTGLGLSLSRQLARAMGGDLILKDSASGNGSVFLMRVAVAEPQAYAFGSAPEQGSSSADQFQLEGLRILVADDAPDNQVLIQRMLTRRGAVVEVVSNGAEAVTKAASRSYDVILMDMQMPVMDGCEATRVIRAAGYSGPILALTAHAMKEERAKTLNAGCNDHLTKPIKITEVVNAIKYHALSGRKLEFTQAARI